MSLKQFDYDLKLIDEKKDFLNDFLPNIYEENEKIMI